MVQLILSSPKGNQGGKYFPYLGYLGLTPVRVEGIVRTKLDSDLKLLPSSSLTISVRCYEHRVGRVNVTNSRILVDHTQVLWSKPDDVEYDNVGVLEYPFRITLPANVAGFSTAVFVDYRCTWRVEAILSHIPITGVGSRQVRHFELPLTRFDLPKSIPSLPASQSVALDQCTSKPRAPRIRYSLQAPTHPVGPSETLSIPLHLQPVDANVAVRSATVQIERRIQLHEPHNSSAPIPIPHSSSHSSQPSPGSRSNSGTPPSGSPHASSTPLSSSHGSYFSSTRQHSSNPAHASSSSDQPYPDHAQSTTSLSSSQPTITPDTVNPSTVSILSWNSETPLLASNYQQIPPYCPPTSSSMTPSANASSSSSAAKVVVNPIVGTETDAFTRDARGVWSTQLSLEWPTSKSHSRWAIGETISSDLVTVKYYVRVKISVSSPGGGTETIDLAEREVAVVSTSEQERVNAQTSYAELVESGRVNDSTLRSKSKSPRRLRTAEKDEMIPPSPAPFRGVVGGGGTSGASGSGGLGSSGSGKVKAPRRPHTSAGPRDKSSFGGKSDSQKKRRSEVAWGTMGMPIGLGMRDAQQQQSQQISAAASGSSRETRITPPSASTSSVVLKSGGGVSGQVANGEITKKSRSSSGGKLSSSSFWAVSAPPLKNHSSSSSGGQRRGTRSGDRVTHSSSSASTTASSSSVSSCGGRGAKGDISSGDEDDEVIVPRRRTFSTQGTSSAIRKSPRMGGESVLRPSSRGMQGKPPPSSFNHPTVVAQAREAEGGSHDVREWEEELARIEEKSRKESDAAGFGLRTRKRSFVSTMKDLLPSRKMFSLGGEYSSS